MEIEHPALYINPRLIELKGGVMSELRLYWSMIRQNSLMNSIPFGKVYPCLIGWIRECLIDKDDDWLSNVDNGLGYDELIVEDHHDFVIAANCAHKYYDLVLARHVEANN